MQVRRCLQHGKACDLPDVTHNPRPFQPALGSSRRPSIRLAKRPMGYGTRTSNPIQPHTYAAVVRNWLKAPQ